MKPGWAGTYGEGGWTNSKRWDRRDNCPDWPLHSKPEDTQLRSGLLSRWIVPSIASEAARSPVTAPEQIAMRSYWWQSFIRRRLIQAKGVQK